jgi:hypothetical protein
MKKTIKKEILDILAVLVFFGMFLLIRMYSGFEEGVLLILAMI